MSLWLFTTRVDRPKPFETRTHAQRPTEFSLRNWRTRATRRQPRGARCLGETECTNFWLSSGSSENFQKDAKSLRTVQSEKGERPDSRDQRTETETHSTVVGREPSKSTFSDTGLTPFRDVRDVRFKGRLKTRLVCQGLDLDDGHFSTDSTKGLKAGSPAHTPPSQRDSSTTRSTTPSPRIAKLESWKKGRLCDRVAPVLASHLRMRIQIYISPCIYIPSGRRTRGLAQQPSRLAQCVFPSKRARRTRERAPPFARGRRGSSEYRSLHIQICVYIYIVTDALQETGWFSRRRFGKDRAWNPVVKESLQNPTHIFRTKGSRAALRSAPSRRESVPSIAWGFGLSPTRAHLSLLTHLAQKRTSDFFLLLFFLLTEKKKRHTHFSKTKIPNTRRKVLRTLGGSFKKRRIRSR